MSTTSTPPGLPHQGFRFYDREICMVGVDDELLCLLVEGTDRRAYAALNRYLRDGESPAELRARGTPRLLPTMAPGRSRSTPPTRTPASRSTTTRPDPTRSLC